MTGTDTADDLGSLASVLGASLVASRSMAWGDAGAAWLVELGDGRRLVARQFPLAERSRAERAIAAMRAAAGAGIPVPIAVLATTARSSWLVTDHVPGVAGAAWLDGPGRAQALAASMGRLHRRLLAVDPSEVRDTPPPGQGAGPRTSRGSDADVIAALEGARGLLARRAGPPVLVHGDFAPVNVLVDAGGEIRALVDFEHAHLGDPLEDIAWWGWVVRHHHPRAWEAAWPTFLAAAGVDEIRDGAVIRALMLRTLDRRATEAAVASTRERWRSRLAEAVRW